MMARCWDTIISEGSAQVKRMMCNELREDQRLAVKWHIDISPHAAKCRTLLVVLWIMSLYGCASVRLYRQGLQKMESRDWESAVMVLEQAALKRPGNMQIEIALDRAKSGAAQFQAEIGNKAILDHRFEDARLAFEKALAFDIFNSIARDGLRTLISIDVSERLYQDALADEQLGNTPSAKQGYREALQEFPEHQAARERLTALEDRENRSPRLDLNKNDQQMISFSFEDTQIIDIFRALAAVSGINILADDSEGPRRRVTVDLNNTILSEAMSNLARTYRLLLIDLNPNTYLLTTDTPENKIRYSEDSVKLFALKYADATQVKSMLEPLLKASTVLADERINAVVVRTDEARMQMVADLVASLDIRESEVLIEMEVLEISRDNVKQFGMHLGDQPSASMNIGGGIKANPDGGTLSISEMSQVSSGQLFLTLPSVYLNLLKKDAETHILAQPRLRILNRMPAKLHIGEKVPIRVTTSRYRDTTEETAVYEYRDVGILMNITPKILSSNELSLELKLEISSILNSGESENPTIGTRDIQTTLRLRDGEAEIIAGLIKDEDRSGTAKLPLLGDIPVMGRLFSSSSQNKQQTDIIISLTPHILDRRSSGGWTDTLWTGNSEHRSGRSEPEHDSIVDRSNQVFIASDTRTPAPSKTPSALADDQSDDGQNMEYPVRVFINPAELALPKAKTASFTVNLENGVNVGSVPFYLEYDPSVFQINEIKEGPFLSGDGRATAFMTSIDNEKGRAIVGMTRLGSGMGISGSGILISVDIMAVQSGESAIRFTHHSVREPSSEPLNSRFENGHVRVTPN